MMMMIINGLILFFNSLKDLGLILERLSKLQEKWNHKETIVESLFMGLLKERSSKHLLELPSKWSSSAATGLLRPISVPSFL